jgi:hypothetical protein
MQTDATLDGTETAIITEADAAAALGVVLDRRHATVAVVTGAIVGIVVTALTGTPKARVALEIETTTTATRR